MALATGYYAGGLLVDRSLRPGRIYGALLVASVYLCLSTAVREPVAFACLKFSLPVGSLLASAFLFFVPLCLLAMVGPFFIRVLTSSLARVGGSDLFIVLVFAIIYKGCNFAMVDKPVTGLPQG